MLWLPAEVAQMNDLLGVHAATIRADVAHHPEIWHEICGHYRLPGSLSDIRARSMISAGVQVQIQAGRPVLRVLTPIPSLLRGLPLHPMTPPIHGCSASISPDSASAQDRSYSGVTRETARCECISIWSR